MAQLEMSKFVKNANPSNSEGGNCSTVEYIVQSGSGLNPMTSKKSLEHSFHVSSMLLSCGVYRSKRPQPQFDDLCQELSLSVQ